MKFLRLKAAIAAIIISVVLALSVIFFSGPLVKMILKSQLESVTGAEVNIDSVSVGISPLSLTVDQLQVADSENPSKNLVEVKQLDFSLKTDSLLKSKFVVSNMAVEGMRLNTERSAPGKVFTEQESEEKIEKPGETSLSLSSIDLPDVNSLMDKVDLQTGPVFDHLEEQINKTGKSWDEIDAFINDKAKWDGYKQRYNKIKLDYKKGNTKEKLLALKALKGLNKEIKHELNKFTGQRKQLKADFNELKIAYKTAKQAPSKDIEKLKNSYSFDEKGLGNISRVLFGDTASEYIAMANKYYKKIAPYLASEEESEKVVARDQGRFVEFKDFHPEPGFLIEKATISAFLANGDFVGTARDIAFEQAVQHKPSVISLSGKNLKHSKAEKITLTIDTRVRNKSIISFKYDIKQRNLNGFEISKNKTLPLKLDSAKLDMVTEVELINKSLSGNADAQFTNAKFESSRDTSSRNMAAMLASAFEQVHRFNVETKATGKLMKPRLDIKSDLDKRLNEQLKIQFTRIKKEFEVELKEKFSQRYADKIKKAEQLMADLDKKKQALEARQNALNKQLEKYKK